MKILGISCFFHDSAACLVQDDQIVAAAAEERFSRIKHDFSFPQQAAEYCLNEAGIAANELDAVVFYEKPIWKFERLLHQHLAHFPKSLPTFIDSSASWLNNKLHIPRVLKEKLHYFGKVYYVPHHLSHAASSYYLSGFDHATIITLDGVGEWASTTIGTAEGDNIQLDREIRFPHSLGLLYSTLTAYLGFSVNNDEYKVMGLAAYGNPEPFVTQLDELISTHPDGSYALNMDYFDYDWARYMPSKKMVELFGHPIRKRDSAISSHHQDIAAALQLKLEEVVLHMLNAAYSEYQQPQLCLAGGVALNSVLNGKLLSQTQFTEVYIPPAPGDAGGAMGAALYLNQVLTKSTTTTTQTSATHSSLSNATPYLGPSYSWHQIQKVLDQHQLEYQSFTQESELLETVSELLRDKQVVGWFQGRMEWGPRALGNRSILAAATSPEMQDILNAKVKHREMFRPFAPVILAEHVQDYFETDEPVPELAKYMLLVYPFKQKAKTEIPSVVHVDGTGRLQSISRDDNQLYYDLISTYHRQTNIPVLINTSFNVRGEPIVCSPEDAVQCFLGTGIDVLVMDKYLVKKSPQ